jgi:hypothetical protein
MSRTVAARAPHLHPSLRRSEIAIALLFLITATAAIGAGVVLDAAFTDPGDLARIAAARAGIATGAALWTVNNVGFVFIALFAWPVLAPVAPFAARAYLATRVLESGVMMIGVMALVTIPGRAAAGDGGSVTLLHALADISLDAGMLPLLGFSGLFLTGRCCSHRLLPAWLAGLGVAAYALVIAVGFLTWFGWVGIGPGDTGFLLVVPVALWEIVLMPIWLLWKGFTPPA